MPFTLSHVVAVLPFYRKFKNHFSISGLMMGSMAPDFEFFIRNTLYGIWGHTLLGMFWFDIPISILLCYVFHRWVRNTLITYGPKFIWNKFNNLIYFDWTNYLKKNFLKVIISIFFGILTHFVWDNLTHEPNYVFPFHFSILSTPLIFFGIKLPIYFLLQILSSIFGLVGFLLIIYYKSNLITIPNNPVTDKAKFWYTFVAVSALIFCFRYAIGIPDEKPFGQFVVISIGSSLYGLVFTSMFFKKYYVNKN